MPDFNFEEYISEETQHRETPAFDPIIPDAEKPPTVVQAPVVEPQPEPIPRMDPKVQAIAWVSLANSANYGIWLTLIQGKLRRKYFESESEFDRAEDLNRKTSGEIARMDESEKCLNLVERYRKYISRIEVIGSRLSFTPDEKTQLEQPLMEMARLHPGFDLPPGLALVFAAVSIIIPRFIMFKQDF